MLRRYTDDLDNTITHSEGIEKLSGKKVMVTGASGTIGSWIVAALLRYNDTKNAGIMVYGTSRDPNRSDWSGRDDYKWIRFDLEGELEFELDVDYIIHAAGNAFPAMFYDKPVETIIGNVSGTDRLLKYALDHNVRRFLFVSSGEVYGDVDGNAEFFTEDISGKVDTLISRSSYPLSKRMVENLCIAYRSEYDLDVVIARCCHTFGPVFSDRDNRANAQFIRNARAGMDIVLNSKGENIRSYLYVADCVSGLLTVLTKGVSGEAYNICDRSSIASIRELAEMIADASGVRVITDLTDSVDRTPTPIKRQTMDDGKLKSLDWNAAFSLNEAVKSIFRQNAE